MNEIKNSIRSLVVLTVWSCTIQAHDFKTEDVWPISVEVKSTAELVEQVKHREGLRTRRVNHHTAGRHYSNDNAPDFVKDIMDTETSESVVLDTQKDNPENSYKFPAPAQTVGFNITAATVADVLAPFVIPPNPSGAIGPQQYILMTYQIIRSFNRTTGLPDGVLDIDASSFFGVSANDVRIDYDRFLHRWFMSCEATDEHTGRPKSLVLAVSRESVIAPCTLWDMYTFSNAQLIPQAKPLGTGILDYQQLALDQHAVYISEDTFDQFGVFLGTSTLVIQKSSLVTGPIVAKVFHGIIPNNIKRRAGFTPPADNFDANPTFGYIIHASNDVISAGNIYKDLFLYRILNPGSTNPQLGHLVKIPVPDYTDAGNAPYKGNLFGKSTFLQTSWSILSAPHVRNHQLFVCHNIQVDRKGVANPKGNRLGVRWYQFDMTGDATGRGLGTETETTVPALVQSGTLFDNTQTAAPKCYIIPSIMTNKNGDMVIACTVTGAKDSPNAVFAGRIAADAPGTLRTPVVLTNSSFPYNFGPFFDPLNGDIGQRFGDLSSVSVAPPPDDVMFISTVEFAALQNGWGIQATQLLPLAPI